MITIIDKQKIPVNKEQLQKDAQRILEYLEYPDFDLGIMLADNATIHEYNKKHRDKDKPTDILSFPFHDKLKAGERIVAKTEAQKNLGDIIISPEYVQEDLPKWEQPFDERMRTLLVHGICHLLGYDHIKDEDYELMQKKEEELLKQLLQASEVRPRFDTD